MVVFYLNKEIGSIPATKYNAHMLVRTHKCSNKCMFHDMIERNDLGYSHDVLMMNEILGVYDTDSPTTWL